MKLTLLIWYFYLLFVYFLTKNFIWYLFRLVSAFVAFNFIYVPKPEILVYSHLCSVCIIQSQEKPKASFSRPVPIHLFKSRLHYVASNPACKSKVHTYFIENTTPDIVLPIKYAPIIYNKVVNFTRTVRRARSTRTVLPQALTEKPNLLNCNKIQIRLLLQFSLIFNYTLIRFCRNLSQMLTICLAFTHVRGVILRDKRSYTYFITSFLLYCKDSYFFLLNNSQIYQ